MPINLTVQADVVDVSVDSPHPSDIFLVDTNVWFWTAYSRASLSSNYQAAYDAYLKKALAVGARLYVAGITQSELIHTIERTERLLYSSTISTKAFRHNCAPQRAAVVAEVTAAWGVVQNIAELIDLRINGGMAARVLTRFQTSAMDGYDLILAESMFEHGIPHVLTDDGDFSCIGGISLFTANASVLRAAASQGKIITR